MTRGIAIFQRLRLLNTHYIVPPGIHALGAAPRLISYRLCCELVASELPGMSQMGRVFCESGIDTDVKQFARKGGNELREDSLVGVYSQCVKTEKI